MIFSSIPFLYYFLPAVLLLYFAAPKRLKNLVLFLTSLFFYFWGGIYYGFIMLAAIVMGYVFGLLIERAGGRGSRRGRVFLTLSLIAGVGLLGTFKCTDFFITCINQVLHTEISLLKLVFPVGISFYTFQIMSYEIDVYRGDTPAQKNIIHFGMYVTFFPQLIAGPIVRYVDIAKEIDHRTHSFENAALGFRRFTIGLAKKVLLANVLGQLCNEFRALPEGANSVLFVWLYAVAFSLQLYFDFSGYSDMAIGLGRICGFKFPENFNYPFISKSIAEFWRRWHMTLGSWFRDYVYIPLGGNRVSFPRWICNILVVWMLTGFWHGANWNFILWGLMFAALLLLEKAFLGNFLKKSPAFVAHIYVTLMVLISFVLFNGTSMMQVGSDLANMFGLGGLDVVTAETWYYLRSYGVVLLLALLGATGLPKLWVERIRKHSVGKQIVDVGEILVLPALLLLVTAFLVDSSYNPFLYFRF